MDPAALRARLAETELAALSAAATRALLALVVPAFVANFDALLRLQERFAQAQADHAALQAEFRRRQRLPQPPPQAAGAADPPAAGKRGSRPRGQVSSAGERRGKRGRRPPTRAKAARNAGLCVTERRRIDLDPADLPPDALFKGYRRVLKQELQVTPCVLQFELARYYSPSQRRTYQAAPPPGWEGQFGPVCKAWILTAGYDLPVAQAPLLRFLTQLGLSRSAGTLARLLTELPARWEAERQAVRTAGLTACPWLQTDRTATTVNGQPQTCHVLGNPTFVHYETRPGADRATVVRVLRGPLPDCYLLDESTLGLLRKKGWSAAQRSALEPYCEPFLRSRAVLQRKLRRLRRGWDRKQEQAFWECALTAAYRWDREGPPVTCLLTDDGAAYHGISREAGLCWVHELRHLKKLRPSYPLHRRELQRVAKQAWGLYRDLQAYRAAPTPAGAAELRAAFGRVFGQTVPYPALQARLRLTRKKAARLLQVLEHPELPLHNNAMELAARRRVRKRDVSYGPRSAAGARAWDIAQGLAATTALLGVQFYEYVLDRLTQAQQIPPLAELVRAQAAALGLGRTWATQPPLIE